MKYVRGNILLHWARKKVQFKIFSIWIDCLFNHSWAHFFSISSPLCDYSSYLCLISQLIFRNVKKLIIFLRGPKGKSIIFNTRFWQVKSKLLFYIVFYLKPLIVHDFGEIFKKITYITRSLKETCLKKSRSGRRIDLPIWYMC